ncbi:unnamed protein product [Amoebophrya sp. A120]|nr:unnamed protein product [Amoebophrya sp. A120]|eukprot:GSA120T00020296001.1
MLSTGQGGNSKELVAFATVRHLRPFAAIVGTVVLGLSRRRDRGRVSISAADARQRARSDVIFFQEGMRIMKKA